MKISVNGELINKNKIVAKEFCSIKVLALNHNIIKMSVAKAESRKVEINTP